MEYIEIVFLVIVILMNVCGIILVRGSFERICVLYMSLGHLEPFKSNPPCNKVFCIVDPRCGNRRRCSAENRHGDRGGVNHPGQGNSTLRFPELQGTSVGKQRR